MQNTSVCARAEDDAVPALAENSLGGGGSLRRVVLSAHSLFSHSQIFDSLLHQRPYFPTSIAAHAGNPLSHYFFVYFCDGTIWWVELLHIRSVLCILWEESEEGALPAGNTSGRPPPVTRKPTCCLLIANKESPSGFLWTHGFLKINTYLLRLIVRESNGSFSRLQEFWLLGFLILYKIVSSPEVSWLIIKLGEKKLRSFYIKWTNMTMSHYIKQELCAILSFLNTGF